jgi:exodeoxyribonuclease V alpha subunit
MNHAVLLGDSLFENATYVPGGPDVGKTTLVNAICKIMRAKRLRVVLAAPTSAVAVKKQRAKWGALYIRWT